MGLLVGEKMQHSDCHLKDISLIDHRFAYAILAADELVAVSQTVNFIYDDGKTFLAWKVGDNVDPAVWISLFLALVIIINMLPVKVRQFSHCHPSVSLK